MESREKKEGRGWDIWVTGIRVWCIKKQEKKKKKRRGWDIWEYTCGAKKTREKKKKKETYGWNNGNTTTIFLQYFHNKS